VKIWICKTEARHADTVSGLLLYWMLCELLKREVETELVAANVGNDTCAVAKRVRGWVVRDDLQGVTVGAESVD
jgi:hypothetical protein